MGEALEILYYQKNDDTKARYKEVIEFDLDMLFDFIDTHTEIDIYEINTITKV